MEDREDKENMEEMDDMEDRDMSLDKLLSMTFSTLY